MTAPDYLSEYAFISVGANLPSDIGDPCDTLEFAFSELAALSTAPLLKSSVYITSPVQSPDGTPDFYNAVAGILPQANETSLSLLHKLQAIENKAGRTRSGVRNEARVLDLDLIMFKTEILNTEELILPHPRAYTRQFVLEPFIELAGNDFVLPGMVDSLKVQLLRNCHGQLLKKQIPL